MSLQNSKKTTLSGNSFKLDTLDPNNYYDATLTANYSSAVAHTTLIPASLTNLTGDSLTATGNNDTLYGGAGRDSLTALGNFDSLIAGSGIDTLVAKGSSDTLVGNGLSSLSSSGTGTTFLLLNASGDTIRSTGGQASILLSPTLSGINFSLLDTFGHGSGVANVSTLAYNGSGAVTLQGDGTREVGPHKS